MENAKETAKTLEEAINEVREDLMPFVGHLKKDYYGLSKYTHSTKHSIKVWIFGEPVLDEEATPEQKREAIHKLYQIYNSSDWYSARYAAGKVLCRSDKELEELEKKYTKWIEKLGGYLDCGGEREAKARKDLEYMRNLPRHMQVEGEGLYDANRKIRVKAGRALGYGVARRLFNEGCKSLRRPNPLSFF